MLDFNKNAQTFKTETVSATKGAPYPSFEPNPKDIRAHLDWLVWPTPRDDALIEIAYTDPFQTAPNRARLFARTEFDEAVRFAVEKNNESRNVYVGAALRSPYALRNKRCTGADFLVATAIPVDIDTDYVATKLRLADVGEDGLVVTTGRFPEHRAQHWQRLDKPCEDAQEYARAFESLVKHVGGDLKVKDAARVMRLAGTISFPDERKRLRGYQIEKTRLIIDDQARPSSLDKILALQPLPASGRKQNGQDGQDGEIVREYPSGRVVNGRETYWCDIVMATLADFQQSNGADPTEDELFHAAFEVFSDPLKVNNEDGRWTGEQGLKELRKRVHNTLRRLRDGDLAKHGLYSIETGAGAEEAERVNEARGAEAKAKPETGSATKAEDSWPDPIGEAAFHGIAGDVVRTFEPHTESDSAAILLQFAAAFGNAAGRDSFYRVESTTMGAATSGVSAGIPCVGSLVSTTAKSSGPLARYGPPYA
jgi:hypothetical protein